MKIYKRRLVSIIVSNKCEQFEAYKREHEKYIKCGQEIVNLIRKLMISGQIKKRVYGRNDLCVVKNTPLYEMLKDNLIEKESKNEILYIASRSTLANTIFKDIFNKHGYLESKISTYKRCIVENAINRFNSHFRRNKKSKKDKQKHGSDVKVPYINFRGDSISVAEGMIYNKEKNTVTITYHNGKLEFPIYQYYGKGDLKKNFGGYITFLYNKQKEIYSVVIRGAIEYFEDPLYDPVGFIGFDINQTPENWIVFESGEKIARPNEMTDAIAMKNIINKEISNKNKKDPVTLRDGTITILKSKDRRKRRKEVEKLLEKIEKICRKYAKSIVDKAIFEDKGLAVDKINPGANGTGEFGQEISKQIIRMCEDRRVPFYVIPSAYSSRECICGDISEDNRKENEFKCVKCGYEANSHVHAAQNMTRRAEKLYDYGVMYFDPSSESVTDGAKQKYLSLEALKTRSDNLVLKFNKKQEELIESN